MLAELSGGSTQDVGCYPIRLARLLFGAEPDLARTIADATWEHDVDTELWGALGFPGDRRLVLSCGFRSAGDTFTRLLGTEGAILMTNPFHPEPGDTIVTVRGDGIDIEFAAPSGEPLVHARDQAFHRVIRGLEEPRHLAVDEALGNARAIAALLAAARGR